MRQLCAQKDFKMNYLLYLNDDTHHAMYLKLVTYAEYL